MDMIVTLILDRDLGIFWLLPDFESANNVLKLSPDAVPV